LKYKAGVNNSVRNYTILELIIKYCLAMTNEKSADQESFKVNGDEILSKIKEIIKEGNARKIIIRNDKDETIIEFTLTIGAIGLALAPIFAAVGTLAALASNCTIVVEKRENPVQ
jgi:hypothetical protein